MNVAIRILCVGLVLPACGDNHVVPTDSSLDAFVIDAPVIPFECPKSGTPPTCAATVAPTTPATSAATCNPLSQTGCGAQEKCTWIVDQLNPTMIGHIGCAPNGTIPIGCACTIGTPGATGYDDCAPGSTCVGGLCKQICDPAGGAPMCGTGFACTGYANVFETGGTRVAGLCDVTCDPLTQCTSVGQTPNACGATNPVMPNRGCYGIASYSCSPVVASSLVLTDRMVPRTNTSGAAFLNGCAPGFTPLFYSMTGSTQVLCAGFCAALEIDNTPAHAGNSKGDATAPAKLPMKDQPFTGDGTCEIGKKGSEATSTCKFIWPYLDDGNGAIDPKFLATGLLDTLGVCFATAHFMYDSNMDGTPDKLTPACNTLPPRSVATQGNFDDAADFGCQKMANSARVAPALHDIHIGLRESIPLVPHTFD
jgi:hypothetical protein